jgi:hypothetical protein
MFIMTTLKTQTTADSYLNPTPLTTPPTTKWSRTNSDSKQSTLS